MEGGGGEAGEPHDSDGGALAVVPSGGGGAWLVGDDGEALTEELGHGLDGIGGGRKCGVDSLCSERVVRQAGRRKKATMIASNQSLILDYLQQKCASVGIWGGKSNLNSNRGPKRKGSQLEGPEPGCKVSRSEEL